ncbi:metallophosphoesterase [uncultured Ruthenibacterium sp.]|mgnify:FL=1|uniref:metallophosphoesterase n=1 Tax=uncultured Ruthenibacterium sp. TaxID=1905347 RepID=UPI00349EB3A8
MRAHKGIFWNLKKAIARREANQPLLVRRYAFKGPGKLRLIQLTDLHLDDRTDWDGLQALVDRVNDLRPDIVVFTGDLVCKPDPFVQWEKAAKILRGIQAPSGKFAVRGNHDLLGADQKALRLLYESGFVFLKNRVVRTHAPDGTPVTIGGLDDIYFQDLSRPACLLPMRYTAGIRVVLIHEPVLAKKVPRGTADLILAGHSHAGQVYAPGLWRIWMTKKVGHYLRGFYRVHGMPLYVCAGLGESGPGFRLFCRRELTVFDFSHTRREEL